MTTAGPGSDGGSIATSTNSTTAAPDQGKIKELTDKITSLQQKLEEAKTQLKEAGGTVSSVTPGGSGISMVTFSVEKREDAENLASKLFKQNLIADSQIIDNNYERFYMKYKKELSDENQVRVNFITADNRVALLVKFIKENYPGSKSDLPLDIISVQ